MATGGEGETDAGGEEGKGEERERDCRGVGASERV